MEASQPALDAVSSIVGFISQAVETNGFSDLTEGDLNTMARTLEAEYAKGFGIDDPVRTVHDCRELIEEVEFFFDNVEDIPAGFDAQVDKIKLLLNRSKDHWNES